MKLLLVHVHVDTSTDFHVLCGCAAAQVTLRKQEIEEKLQQWSQFNDSHKRLLDQLTGLEERVTSSDVTRDTDAVNITLMLSLTRAH